MKNCLMAVSPDQSHGAGTDGQVVELENSKVCTVVANIARSCTGSVEEMMHPILGDLGCEDD